MANSGSDATYSTITLILTTTISLLVLFKVSRPLNWWKGFMLFFVVAFCITAVTLNLINGSSSIFYSVLQLQPLGREDVLLLLLFMQAAYPTMVLIDKLLVKLRISKEYDK